LEFGVGKVESAGECVGDGVVFALYVLWKQHTGRLHQGSSQVASDVVVEVFTVFVKVTLMQPTGARGAVCPCQQARVGFAGWVKANGEPYLDHGTNELEQVVGDLGIGC
jgi:hypothetical protein